MPAFNTPSVKTLIERLRLDAETAREAKRILTATRAELEAMPAGAARVAECYNPPHTYDLRLHCLDARIGTYGVECFHTKHGEPVFYLNAGDTYAPTIVRFRGRYRVACWGDIAERHGAH